MKAGKINMLDKLSLLSWEQRDGASLGEEVVTTQSLQCAEGDDPGERDYSCVTLKQLYYGANNMPIL